MQGNLSNPTPNRIILTILALFPLRMASTDPGTCYSCKKGACQRTAGRRPNGFFPWNRVLLEGNRARIGRIIIGLGVGFYRFPWFGSRDLSNHKDDKTKNDAMVNFYPLECPKPIILPRKIEESRKSIKSDPNSSVYPKCTTDVQRWTRLPLAQP